MALMIEDKKPFYTSTESNLKLGLFLAHAVSSVFMLMKAYGSFDDSGCKPVILPGLQMVPVYNSYITEFNPPVYRMVMDRARNVTDCETDGLWDDSWCKFKNLPQYFDYEWPIDSFIPGSSWNVIFAITVFEWITASYALFYYDPFDNWLTYEPLWWGLHPVPVLCSAWNLFLILFMWCNRARMAVPYNNCFLYTMALAVTIVIHNYLSINRSWRIDDEKEESQSQYVETKKTTYELRTDLFLRHRKNYQLMQKSIGFDFHQPNYMILFDKCSCSPIPRYLEYMLTAPLLLAALYASSVPSDLVWKFQWVVMALMACNAVGVPLHYSVLRIGIDVKRYVFAAAYFFTASWMCLLTGLYIFIWTLREFLTKNDSGMPQWVQLLVWIMIVLYAMFGFIASRYYLPRIIWGTPYDAEDYRRLGFYFDICSLLIKLPIAWTIWVKGAIISCEKSVTC